MPPKQRCASSSRRPACARSGSSARHPAGCATTCLRISSANHGAGATGGQQQKWFALRFLGEDSEINITPAAGHKAEFTEWRWLPLAEVADLIVPFKRAVYEQVIAAFTDYARPGT